MSHGVKLGHAQQGAEDTQEKAVVGLLGLAIILPTGFQFRVNHEVGGRR